MGKYSVGIDMASGSDYLAVTWIQHRKIRWYHFLLKRLHLIKHLPAPYKVVDHFTSPLTNLKGKAGQ